MRISKELIIIAVLLFVTVWDVVPRRAEYVEMRDQLRILKKQVASEKLFSQKREEIAKQLEAALKVHQENQKRIFPANIPSGTAMSQLQDTIKKTIQQNGLEMVNSRWGEPFREAGTAFFKLPVSFTVQGGPPEMTAFLQSLASSEKFLKCPLLSINLMGKTKLQVDIMITGYQLAPEGK